MDGHVLLGDHSYPRMRLEDVAELPKILYAFKEAIRHTKSESTTNSYVNQLKRLFVDDMITPEAMTMESYLKYCHSRPENRKNGGQTAGAVKNLMQMWASKPESWPDLPPDLANLRQFQVKIDLSQMGGGDSGEPAVKKQKVDGVDSSEALPNGESAANNSSDKVDNAHDSIAKTEHDTAVDDNVNGREPPKEDELDEPPSKKIKADDQVTMPDEPLDSKEESLVDEEEPLVKKDETPIKEDDSLAKQDEPPVKQEVAATFLDSIMPPDAPAGHESYSKLKVASDYQGNPCIKLYYQAPGNTRRSSTFQLSVAKCGGEEAAYRIARICSVKFEEGVPVDEVIAFRTEWYERMKHIDMSSITAGTASIALSSPSATSTESGQPVLKMEESIHGDEKLQASTMNSKAEDDSASVKDEANAKEEDDKASAKDTEEESEVTMEMLASVLPPDAPPGHRVYGKISIQEDHVGAPVARLTYKFADGSKKQLQISVKKCCLPEAALRVARACYVKWDEGASIDEVTAFRDEMYEVFKPFAGKLAHNTTSTGPTSEKESNSRSAVQDVAVPSPPATAAPNPPDITGINWDDVLPAEPPADHEVWKRTWSQTKTGDCRFKCPDGLNYQVTARPCLGDAELQFRVSRLVYVKVGSGASKEETTAYRGELYAMIENAVANRTNGKVPATTTAPATTATEVKAPATTAIVEEPKKKAADKPKKGASDSSDSASDSDSSSSESEGEKAKKAIENPFEKNSVQKSPKKAPRNIVGKAVAKMSVRSGFRCPCHYAVVCPKGNGSSS